MWRFVRNYGVLVVLCLGVAYALLYALAPDIATTPWRAYKEATKGWRVLDPGPVKGLAIGIADSQSKFDFPAEFGASERQYGGAPGELGFLVRLPREFNQDFVYRRGSTEPRAFLVSPDAARCPVQIYGGFKDKFLGLVTVPADYPPDRQHLDVCLEVPGEKSTTFRLTRLADTRDWFSNHLPVQKFQVSGVSIEGQAFQATPDRPGAFPVIAMETRVNSMPSGEKWEWRDVAMALPFGQSAAKETPYTAYASAEPLRPLGIEFLAAYPSDYKLGRISGKLARYEDIVEDLDFGDVPIALDNAADKNKFRLAIHSPISRRTHSGFVLSLLPEGTPRSFSNLTCGWPFVCLVLKPETPQTIGLGGDDKDIRLAVSFDNKVFSEVSFKPQNANGVPGEHMMPAKLDEKSKSIRIRLRVQRKRYLEEHPFELFVPIQRGRPADVTPIFQPMEIVAGVKGWPNLSN